MAKMARLLRAFFGPLLPHAWIYPAVPVISVLGETLSGEPTSLAEYGLRFAIPFVAITAVGLPAQVMYIHLGHYFFADRFEWRELIFHGLIVVPCVLLGVEVAYRILDPLVRSAGEPELMAGWRPIGWAVGSISVFGFSFIALQLNRSKDRIAAVELRESEARRAALAAQLQALQARVQPHFLFNCFNTVAGLIEEDPKRATQAVEMLSDLYRYVLDASRHTTVRLDEELGVVRHFLALEGLRYGNRLRSTLDIDPESLDAQLPPLILQPIVENAVLHGISQRRGGGRLELSTRVLAATDEASDVERHGRPTLLLSVEDDGPGLGRSDHAGSGQALADLRQRLELLYGDAAELREGKGELGGTRVELRLPFERGPRSLDTSA
jgi:two-component system sensor histidine kinase AlgZ